MSPLSDNSPFIPSLVFFETTTACDYTCRHCRAEAQSSALPGQLSTGESLDLIYQISRLGEPMPEIIFTGGNTLLRDDFREIIQYAGELGVPFSVSPAGSSMLSDDMLDFLNKSNAGSISLSIDGTADGTHDWLRMKEGSFEATLDLVRKCRAHGLKVQVNTTVMKRNLLELPAIARLVSEEKVSAWELFFLIRTGRGASIDDVSPSEYMQLNNWLADLSGAGLTVRTVEGPVHRVVKAMRKMAPGILEGPLYEKLCELGPSIESTHGTADTGTKHHGNGRKFRGTLFIGYDGTVSPSGLFNIKLGNVRNFPLSEILSENSGTLDYRNSGKLEGKCGICNFRHICGGSRARALYATGNPFAQDPDCLYTPEAYIEEAA